MRTQVPWPWLDDVALGVSSRRFFYDGGRRIQERVTAPLPVGEDGKALEITKELDLNEVEVLYPSIVSREYVWDPDQTDRLLAQIAAEEYAFVATDESWTPLAQVEGGSGPTYGQRGKVIDQYSFDPLGMPLDREDLNSGMAPGRRLDVGHQGLFFESFEDETVAYNGLDGRLNRCPQGLGPACD